MSVQKYTKHCPLFLYRIPEGLKLCQYTVTDWMILAQECAWKADWCMDNGYRRDNELWTADYHAARKFAAQLADSMKGYI